MKKIMSAVLAAIFVVSMAASAANARTVSVALPLHSVRLLTLDDMPMGWTQRSVGSGGEALRGGRSLGIVGFDSPSGDDLLELLYVFPTIAAAEVAVAHAPAELYGPQLIADLHYTRMSFPGIPADEVMAWAGDAVGSNPPDYIVVVRDRTHVAVFDDLGTEVAAEHSAIRAVTR